MYRAVRRLQKFGQQIEAGRLARAIWPNQRMNFTTPHFEIDSIDRNETLELLGQVFGNQYEIVSAGVLHSTILAQLH